MWLENWKIHVGYEQHTKGETPVGKKYGRNHPGKLNVDICPKDIEAEYHELPAEYNHLDLPLMPNK
jgi:hypothetical protein